MFTHQYNNVIDEMKKINDKLNLIMSHLGIKEEESNGFTYKLFGTNVSSYTKQEKISRAREDIELLTSRKQLLTKNDNGAAYYQYVPDKNNPVQFNVNEEKRTVVAYLKSSSLKKAKTIKLAIAKCMPTDEFIAEVGMAIAVYRLFDFPVPKIYTE
jgi:hypothetical protein